MKITKRTHLAACRAASQNVMHKPVISELDPAFRRPHPKNEPIWGGGRPPGLPERAASCRPNKTVKCPGMTVISIVLLNCVRLGRRVGNPALRQAGCLMLRRSGVQTAEYDLKIQWPSFNQTRTLPRADRFSPAGIKQKCRRVDKQSKYI